MTSVLRILSAVIIACLVVAVYLVMSDGPQAPRSSGPSGPVDIRATLAGTLVNPDQTPYDDAALADVEYFAFYYSAGWCGPCRQFTPELVKWYHHTKPLLPHVELVFVSNDRDAEKMAGYMAAEKMPWPAVSFDRIGSVGPILEYAGSGIPCLVLVDEHGAIVADTNVNGDYLGPARVVDAMNEIAEEHLSAH